MELCDEEHNATVVAEVNNGRLTKDLRWLGQMFKKDTNFEALLGQIALLKDKLLGAFADERRAEEKKSSKKEKKKNKGEEEKNGGKKKERSPEPKTKRKTKEITITSYKKS